MTLYQDRDERTDAEPRQQCMNCGQFITRRFARVFGDNEDRVHACIQCSTLNSLREGKAGASN